MNVSKKSILAAISALAAATSLSGCAAGPYYDGYTYDSYGNRYGYAEPYYYGPAYVGPSIGLGLGYTYSDRDYRDHRHREWRRDHRDRDRDGVPDARPEPYYERNPVDGQGNPRGHGGPGGAPAKDGGSPG